MKEEKNTKNHAKSIWKLMCKSKIVAHLQILLARIVFFRFEKLFQAFSFGSIVVLVVGSFLPCCRDGAAWLSLGLGNAS